MAKIPIYYCKVQNCKKKYTSMYNVRRHVKTEHSNYKPYKCEYCDKSFPVIAYLKEHAITHTSAKTFLCKIGGCC